MTHEVGAMVAGAVANSRNKVKNLSSAKTFAYHGTGYDDRCDEKDRFQVIRRLTH